MTKTKSFAALLVLYFLTFLLIVGSFVGSSSSPNIFGSVFSVVLLAVASLLFFNAFRTSKANKSHLFTILYAFLAISLLTIGYMGVENHLTRAKALGDREAQVEALTLSDFDETILFSGEKPIGIKFSAKFSTGENINPQQIGLNRSKVTILFSHKKVGTAQKNLQTSLSSASTDTVLNGASDSILFAGDKIFFPVYALKNGYEIADESFCLKDWTEETTSARGDNEISLNWRMSVLYNAPSIDISDKLAPVIRRSNLLKNDRLLEHILTGFSADAAGNIPKHSLCNEKATEEDSVCYCRTPE